MTPDLLIALALFGFVSSITPGPNNTMLMASGANFGFGRTVPHLSGVVVGFPIMVIGIGLGLGGVFTAFPVLHDVLRVVGAAYLLYLAYKLARSDSLSAGPAGASPMTFWQAVAFQWVNPKAWAMALGTVANFVPKDGYTQNVVMAALVFAVVNGPCVATWAGFGVVLRRFLARPGALRAFNVTMAVLLVATLIWTFQH
jgi:threonine/homoserine/homoserine lactone efflux protein